MWYHRMARVPTSPISNAWRVMSSKLSQSMGSPFVKSILRGVVPGLPMIKVSNSSSGQISGGSRTLVYRPGSFPDTTPSKCFVIRSLDMYVCHMQKILTVWPLWSAIWGMDRGDQDHDIHG